MATGILRRGFTVNNDVYRIRIPRNTIVQMGVRDGVPTILFKGLQARLHKLGDAWYFEFYGCLMLVKYDPERVPYPLSYFKS